MLYKDPTNFFERKELAQTCVADLKIEIPTLIDELNDKVADDYDAMPDRLYIVDDKGKIAFSGAQGPQGFKPEQMEPRLREILDLPPEGRVLEDQPVRNRRGRRRPR